VSRLATPPTPRVGLLWVLPLVACWALLMWVVEPRGEYLVNDDFAYVHALEALLNEGRIAPTGWAGGPSLIVHLLWGGLFVKVFGWSLDTLRVSVETAGLLGALALTYLLLRSGVRRPLAYVCGLTLAYNPLFVALSCSFMTDVTFTSLVALTLLLAAEALRRSDARWLAAALLASAAATLVRQHGLVVMAALVLVCILHPQGSAIGRRRVAVLAAALGVAPWLAWEGVLAAVGSTPITRHWGLTYYAQVIAENGFLPGTAGVLFRMVAVCLGYTAFFVSPVLLMTTSFRALTRRARIALITYASAAGVFELAVLLGWLLPPVVLHTNVLFDLGLGPLLFKDTYLLHIRRVASLSPAAYGALVLWAMGWVPVLLTRLLRAAWRLRSAAADPVTSLAALAALLFCAALPFVGFFDRYLIPVVLLAIVGTCGNRTALPSAPWRTVAAGVLLAIVGAFSAVATHDFIATRRAADEAWRYVVGTLGVAPCDFDAGFERSGRHCFQAGFTPRPGMAWWWVQDERVLLTLGPLPGYRTVRTFPIVRRLGPNGAVHVLEASAGARTGSPSSILLKESPPTAEGQP
jgi:4-amino-4-deoxy-L-arabinose transferase-like glycosyltransferase